MEYVYAALLLHKLQKEINEENISSVVKASGSEVNQSQVKALVAALADVKIDEAIKAAPAVVAAPTPQAEAAGAEEKKEGKKEDKKEKEAGGKSEEEAMEGLSSLFG